MTATAVALNSGASLTRLGFPVPLVVNPEMSTSVARRRHSRRTHCLKRRRSGTRRCVAHDAALQAVRRDDVIPASAHSTGSAVGWSFVMNSARLLATLGTAFVLARLLGPAAFGTVALALLFVTLVQLLIQQGMVPAIVQRPELTWRHLDSAFWMTLAISLALTAACAALAPLWARVSGVPEATDVIWVLSALIVVKGLVVVHEGLLQRQLQFRDLAIRTTVASVSGAVVGITWALIHPTIWALVAQQLTGAGVGALVVWRITPWRPRARYRRDDTRDLLGFASKATLSSLGVFISTRIDALLISVFFGATAIGLYQLGYRLVQSAVDVTVAPIAGVALADLSRRHGDRDALGRRYETFVESSAVIGAPVMAVVFACARPLMRSVGPEWEAAAPALQFLCVVGLVTVIGTVNSPTLQAAGRPGAQALLVWFGAAISAATFTVAGFLLVDRDVGDQVVGMAGSRALVYAVILLPVSQLVLIQRIVGVSPTRFLRAVGPPVIASSIAAAGGLAVQEVPAVADAPSGVVVLVAASTTALLAAILLLASSPVARLVVGRSVGALATYRAAHAPIRAGEHAAPAPVATGSAGLGGSES